MRRVFAILLSTVFLASLMAVGEQVKPFTADRHKALGLTCADCHGEGQKAPVTGDKCLSCHQSYEEVAKRTQDIHPNPHSNHLTENDLDCTGCHHGHKADQIYCSTCHSGISFKRNPPTVGK